MTRHPELAQKVAMTLRDIQTYLTREILLGTEEEKDRLQEAITHARKALAALTR